LDRKIKKRIERLAASGVKDALIGGLKGVEKESLRVTSDGYIAPSAHPAALGAAMTNRFITTDFSEALLEFVTPAMGQTWEALRVLCEIHQFTYERIGNELLWVASMPCRMAGDDDIPLARYGSSNVGRMKTVYRNGLGYRYGRKMQTIAGVHFNYSLPEAFWPVYREIEAPGSDADVFRSESYMGLVRNFRRFGWLVLYLLGSSPALCKSFMGGDDTDLESYDESTYYLPFATSLRMSDLGYNNSTQARLAISLNKLDEYIRDLSGAICTPEPRYEAIGVKVDGEYRQLNANMLQIENEYYSPIRPKRVANSGERPTAALRRGGVEYVEVRSVDLNVFDPVGISQNAMRFLEAFLIYCLLHDSPPLDEEGLLEVARNHGQTARMGRDPGFVLYRSGESTTVKAWAGAILEDVAAIAEIIDGGTDTNDYAQAVKVQAEAVEDADRTPSARVMEEMRRGGNGFFHFAMEAARRNKDYFARLEPLSPDRLDIYANEARDSIRRQQDIEQSDRTGFDEYLAAYYSEQGCC
jgi:glutamate--cysteine ligase